MPKPRQYEMTIAILDGDIDGLGHVNNLVYLRWVQDVATAHWTSTARPQDQRDMVWVVVRHEIDYLKSAKAGDEVLARTWVEAWGGATSERHTRISRRADGELLARAKTTWCALDPSSGRPRRIPDDMTHAFLEDE